MSDHVFASPPPTASPLLSEETEARRQRLVDLRARVRRERTLNPTPAVDHALRLAELYLQIGLGYCGHNDDLFPEESVLTW